MHIAYSEGKNMIGTARFASINTHLGMEQSRRDDMESLGYLLVYLLTGNLPWQGIKAKTKTEKYAKIYNIKSKSVPSDICKFLAGMFLDTINLKYLFNYKDEFITYFDYVRSLQFQEIPKYDYLRGLFKKVFHRFQYKMDYIFDWTIYTTQSVMINNILYKNLFFICYI